MMLNVLTIIKRAVTVIFVMWDVNVGGDNNDYMYYKVTYLNQELTRSSI
jgi:hypothetical protein